MKRLLVALGFLLAFASPSVAANCPTFTYTLTNGQTADANQVMANFNTLLNCSNNSLAHNGANADITTLSALTSLTLPASQAAGATFTIFPGTAPSAPTNGNIWTTTTGLFARLNGVTDQFMIAGNNLSDLASAATARTNLGVTATGGDTTYAFRANNLSDLASAATARTNLGLGTSATVNTGTSGATIPLLNGANTWSATQTFSVAPVLPSASVPLSALATQSASTIVANTTGGSASPTAVTITSLQGSTSSVFAAGNDARFSTAPQNGQCSYTLVLGDAGRQIYCNTAGTHTLTIPANASVAFVVGTKIDVVNDCSAGVMTVAITTDTLVWFPSGTTGSRSISACGEATLSKVGTTRWVILGQGVS